MREIVSNEAKLNSSEVVNLVRMDVDMARESYGRNRNEHGIRDKTG